MNVTDPQHIIDDFERLLCDLTQKRELSLVTAEKQRKSVPWGCSFYATFLK